MFLLIFFSLSIIANSLETTNGSTIFPCNWNALTISLSVFGASKNDMYSKSCDDILELKRTLGNLYEENNSYTDAEELYYEVLNLGDSTILFDISILNFKLSRPEYPRVGRLSGRVLDQGPAEPLLYPACQAHEHRWPGIRGQAIAV